MRAPNPWIIAATVALVLGGTAVFRYQTTARLAPAPAAETGQRIFAVEGFLRDFSDDNSTVDIEHEEIPGFMPAMTMPFYLEKPGRPTGVALGDAVAFDFVVGKENSFIRNLRRIDASRIQLPAPKPAPAFAAGASKRLTEGDPAPAFTLFDQSGARLTLADLRGQSVLLTFIFTRCPVPDFCPLMSRNFSAIHEQLSPELRRRTVLLSISFDTEYDTPEMLKLYGSVFTKDFDTWKFASSAKDEIDRLTSLFSVYTRKENGTISHGLCTVLINPEGRIVRLWRGNTWTTSEVLSALADLPSPAPLPTIAAVKSPANP